MEYQQKTTLTRATATRLLPLVLFVSPYLSAQSLDLARNIVPAYVTPTFKVSVDTVILSVGVFFPAGTKAPVLAASDFDVLEEGTPREVVYFTEANSPLSIVLLIDCSESMRAGAMQEAKQAALTFVAKSHPDTEFAVISFSDEVRTVLPFTRDRLKIRNAVYRLTPGGGTRLYDGIRSAIERCSEAEYRTHAIVLLTDGRDEISRTPLTDVLESIQKSDVVIFPCGVYSPAYRRLFLNDKKYYIPPEIDHNLNPAWVLREIASLSGTTALFPDPARPLDDALAEITRELAQRYTVGFRTSDTLINTGYRHVEVKLKNRDGVRIQTRQGYLR